MGFLESMGGVSGLANLGMAGADTAATSTMQLISMALQANNIQEALRLVQEGGLRYTGMAEDIAQQYGGRYASLPGDVTQQFQETMGDVPQNWEQRQWDIMEGRAPNMAGRGGFEGAQPAFKRIGAMFEGMGEQERSDIQQQYRNLMGTTEQDLASRGLAGSTALPSMRAGVGRMERADLGRLDERLRGQRIGFETGAAEYLTNLQQGLTGDTQQANERYYANMFDQWRSATQEGMQNEERLAWTPMQYDQAAIDRIVALRSGIDIRGPDQGAYQSAMQGYGAAGAPAPRVEQPSSGPAWAQAIGGPTAAVGSALLLRKAIPGVTVTCVDIDATLETPHGPLAIRDVGAGDRVMAKGEDGAWHRVLTIHRGEPHERQPPVVEIAAGGHFLALTTDHVIGGRSAGEWKVGEKIAGRLISDIVEVKPREAANVLLEGEVVALVNGFPVAYMKPRSEVDGLPA